MKKIARSLIHDIQKIGFECPECGRFTEFYDNRSVVECHDCGEAFEIDESE